jgi:hypothetical protein
MPCPCPSKGGLLMPIYRMDLIKNGCPICVGDVTGNEKYKYFCKKCRMLFEAEYIENGALHKEHRTKNYFFEK